MKKNQKLNKKIKEILPKLNSMMPCQQRLLLTNRTMPETSTNRHLLWISLLLPEITIQRASINKVSKT